MSRSSTAVALVVAFAAGVALRDVAQDWKDAKVKAELARQAYSCSGYLVVNKRGDHECRALMPRFEPVLPYPGQPFRLKRREIRQAVGGPAP